MPPPCFQRPWRSISWVGAPFWAMRRAMPTRPLWPLKSSQSARAGGPGRSSSLVRAICDSDSPNTFSSLASARRPDGVQSLHGGRGDGDHRASSLHIGLGANHGNAAAAVSPSAARHPRSARLLRNAAIPRSDSTATRARSKRARWAACRGRFEAAAAGPGFRSGEPNHGQARRR